MKHKTWPIEYKAWSAMRNRCNNPNDIQYVYWGGRGISVCERWNSFESFLKDMGPKPIGLSLDRIDNDGDYEPDNCRWATTAQQNMNKRLYSNNTSGVKGVCWCASTKKWFASFKRKTLGRFSNFNDACVARAQAEEEYKNEAGN